METNNFYEVQYFRKKWIFYFSLVICIPLLLLMIYGLINQVYFGIPFGSHPVSDSGIWILSGAVLVVTAGIPFLIYITKLTVKVTDDRFCFCYFPFQIRYRKIKISDVENFEIRQFRPIEDYGGWGIRKTLTKKETAYIVSGKKGIMFSLKNGKKILVGTQRPEELLEAVKKLK